VEQLTTYRVLPLLETCYWPYEVFTCEVVQGCTVHIVVWFQGCYREIALRIRIVVHFDGCSCDTWERKPPKNEIAIVRTSDKTSFTELCSSEHHRKYIYFLNK